MITDPGMRARVCGTDYANYVRSLCVGADRTLTNLKTSKSLEEEMSFPFPFLRCLEFLDRAPHRDIMSSLLSTPFLENLTMTWVETWAFPMIDRHRHLHTLRLKIIPSPCRYSLPEKTYACLTEHELSSLTTLHIANYFEADWADHFWLQSKFPNLRVINVQNTRATCRTVFDFVHCHPTLLEVNIGFIDAIDIRLEAILKLIDGTGSWRTPGGLETFVERGNPRCFYVTTDGRRNYLDEPEMDMEKLTVFPDDIPNTRFTTASFAFKRVPLSPEATQWDKREGSSKARYQATEFAILLSSQDFLEFSGAAFGHFTSFSFSRTGSLP
ncbi:hypothetical protein QCA50_002350 [Cerrena zonata]|uniref:F-box domain-containing protein n=1 Tax=Cerrena zonata TaxID=2478898 RepID=A0AAW0GPM1_9APHY